MLRVMICTFSWKEIELCVYKVGIFTYCRHCTLAQPANSVLINFFPFAAKVKAVSCLLVRAVGLKIYDSICTKFPVLLLRTRISNFHLPDHGEVLAVGWGLTEEDEAWYNTSYRIHSLLLMLEKVLCHVSSASSLAGNEYGTGGGYCGP